MHFEPIMLIGYIGYASNNDVLFLFISVRIIFIERNSMIIYHILGGIHAYCPSNPTASRLPAR